VQKLDLKRTIFWEKTPSKGPEEGPTSNSDRSGVNSINAHKNIFMNLQKYECRLMSWFQAHKNPNFIKKNNFIKILRMFIFMILHKIVKILKILATAWVLKVVLYFYGI